MGTINPRARGGNSLSETLAARRKREEQLGRQRVVIPKPVTAAPAPGSGPSGGPSGLVRATFNDVDLSLAGFVRPAPGSWSFGDPNTRGETPGTPPGLVESTFGHLNVTQSGWYSMSLRGYCWFDGAPTFMEVRLNPASTTALSDTLQLTQRVPTADGANPFHISLPAAWVPSPADDPSNLQSGSEIGVLGFEVYYPSGTVRAFDAWIDVVRLG